MAFCIYYIFPIPQPELKIPSQIRANAGLMGGASLINKDI